jgi:hypothetical protein
MYLDLHGAGIGNIVLMLSGYIKWCSEVGVFPAVLPQGDSIGGVHEFFLNLSKFPAGSLSKDARFHANGVCNLHTLMDPGVLTWMRRLVIPPPNIDEVWRRFQGVEAGMCIRASDARHDGDSSYMNARAIQAIKTQMLKYSKVFVCSNDASLLQDLPPNAMILEETDASKRNEPSHWLQWHELSRCPVVYHGISGVDGSITSTFAPTAGAYGGATMVGIDNQGNVKEGMDYHW